MSILKYTENLEIVLFYLFNQFNNRMFSSINKSGLTAALLTVKEPHLRNHEHHQFYFKKMSNNLKKLEIAELVCKT